ncbi:uncharacterized protein [Cicer arietinum]|uniref:uncharacterized protein n=1 Tax=Cicer arietinum TaxID=3827 RepID=UPI003CC63551
MAQRTSGNLPSDTVSNPRNNVNAVTTRSGKVREQVPPEAKQSRSTLTPTHREEMVTPISVEEHNAIEKEEEPVFLDVFKKLHINIPFAEALEQMPTYAKFMKDIMSKKRKIGGEIVMLTEECSAILQRKLPPKLKDPGSFSIPCAIGNRTFGKALCDLGASVSLMPLSIYKKLGIGKVKDTQLMLQFADRSMKHPYGVVEDVLVKVDKFIFPVDFVVLDMEEDNDIPLILGRPFLATGRAMIDVADGTLTLKVNEETVTFNILKAREHSKEREGCNRIEILDEIERSMMKIVSHEKKLQQFTPQVFSRIIETWNSETLLFHMSFGEMTITLDDVANLLGIYIRGEFYNPPPNLDKVMTCNLVITLLGVPLEEIWEEKKKGAYYR